MKELSCEVAVVGGGINGLCTLAHLHRMGVSNLLLLERFRVGHDRGSSHGKSRITRSAYSDQAYARLMQVVHSQEWPRLEKDLDVQLVYKTTGCFYGARGNATFTKYANSVTGLGLDVEVVSGDEARKLYPLFRFEDVEGVLLDRTAGLVAAERTIVSLDRHLASAGVSRLENAPVRDIDLSGSPVLLRTDEVLVRAERVIVTAGSWADRILPVIEPRVTAARQTVGYVRLVGDPSEFTVDAFPVWGSFNDEPAHSYYGLPQFERDGIKLARHGTKGREDDPDDDPPSPGATIAELTEVVGRHFSRPIVEFVATEPCLYTNTDTEDYILDLHPENDAVVIGAGFSGHGFKLGPLTGRILAELALNRKTGIPEFEEERRRFSVAGARG